jgi:hypothetical protein
MTFQLLKQNKTFIMDEMEEFDLGELHMHFQILKDSNCDIEMVCETA